MMHNILYLTYQENPFRGNKAIIITQVEQLLKVLSDKNSITWIMVYNSQMNISHEEIELYKKDLQSFGIRFIPLSLKEKNIYTGFNRVYYWVKKYLSENPTDIIHCRGYAMTLAANLSSKKEKVIFDMRGVYPNECKINKKKPINYIEYFIWSIIESYNVKNSHAIVTVTKYFKEYVISKYQCMHEKVKVVYNCVDMNNFGYSEKWRQSIREEFNCKEKYVVVFNGSILDKWQSFDQISQMYTDLKNHFKNTLFIILTRDNEVDFSAYGLKPEDIIVKNVANKDVDKYLSASDVGLLVRKDDIVNRVSFPVKFSEYMACGLPVIINDSMKGICEIINEKGIIYKNKSRNFQQLKQVKREKCIEFAKTVLDTKVIAGNYQRLYQQLMKCE